MMSETNFNLGDMLSKFNLIKKGISKLGHNPVLQNIYIAVSNKLITMRTFNNVIQLEASFSCNTKGDDFDFCVSPFFFKVLQKSYSKDKDIFLVWNNEEIKISQEGKSNNFSIVPGENFPPPILVKNYSPLNIVEFNKAITLLKVATSDKKATRLVTKTIKFDVINKRILTTNFEQASFYEKIDINGEDTFIEVSTLTNDIPFDYLTLCTDVEAVFGEWSGIRSVKGGISAVINRFNIDREVDILPLFDKLKNSKDEISNICNIEVNRQNIIDALTICKLYEVEAISYASNSYTDVEISSNSISFTITVQDLSTNKEVITLDYFEGEPHKFSFKASRLLEILEKLNDETIILRFFVSGNNDEPLIVESPKINLFNYLQVL